MCSHLCIHASTPAMCSKRLFEQQCSCFLYYLPYHPCLHDECARALLFDPINCVSSGFRSITGATAAFALHFFFLLFQPTLNALECALLPCFTTLCLIRHLMCLFLLLWLALPCFYYIHLGILLLKQGFLTFWYNGCPNMIILKKNKGSSVWSIIKTKTNLYG